MGKFAIKPTNDGRYMFNLIANNNQVICTSQTYASIATCKVGAESVRTNCAVDVEDQTVEGYEALIKASNGEIVAASQAYADKASCLKGIRSIGSHAPDAEIVVMESEE